MKFIYRSIVLALISGIVLIQPLSAEEQTTAETQNNITSPKVGNAANGEIIFNNICVHCHTTTYDESRIGAPGLRSVIERHSESWLDQWLKSPEDFAKTDVIARDLIDSNSFGLAMPTLPAMQDDQKRKDVIAFLKTLK